jgi:GT2 family glycosyltransferase
VDSNSNDGSREILESHVRNDPRIRLIQAPRDGIYANLNRCLELSTGSYVYIATSDDTMTPDCLERMVRALEENRDCGLGHCCLEIIDETGGPVSTEQGWHHRSPQKYFGPWIHQPHIRRAPHDGMLHFGLGTVYASLTQLLIRRRVFEELGWFRTDCGPHADFEWGMRIGLQENVLHIPQALATWRRHRRQATQPDEILRAHARGDFRRFISAALTALRSRNPALSAALRTSRLHDYCLVSEIVARRQLGRSPLARLSGTGGFLLKHPVFCLRWLFCKIVRQQSIIDDFGEAVRSELDRLGFHNCLCRLET